MIHLIKQTEELSKGREMFREKTTLEEFKSLKSIASIARWAFALFSVVTGVAFLFAKSQVLMHPYVGLLVAVVILFCLELIKHQIAHATFKRILPNRLNLTGIFMLLVLLSLTGLSIFLSVHGTKEAYLKLDTSASDLDALYQDKIDSINTVYQQKINGIKAEQRAFYEANQVYVNKAIGKVLRYDATKPYNQFVSRITDYEKDQKSALLKLENAYQNRKEKVLSESDFNLAFWLTASCIIEGLIILCLYFVIWYYWRVNLESQYIIPSKSKIEDYVRSFSPYFVEPAATAKEIGFKSKPAGEKQAKEWALEKDVKGGARDIKHLMQKHHVNVRTVHNMIQKYESKKN